MAGLEGAHADEGYANTGGPKDGPVLTMMSKRLRALRKKFNRILQIEENKAQGKTVNKEQEDVLRTKIAVAALIDEYEKLRQPLLVAVKEEVTEREKELLAASLEREEEEVSVAEDDTDGAAAPPTEVAAKDIAAAEKEGDVAAERAAANAVAEGEEEAAAGPDLAEPPQVQANGLANGEPREAADAAVSESPAEDHEDDSSSTGQAATMADSQIVDLLTLLYFAQMFDMRSPGEAPSYVWTKVHERNSCLSYDLIKDDVTTPLVESDLEALAVFGSLLTTRPPNVTLSHRDALEKCVDHARSWLATSDSSIGDFYPQLPISYSGLREKLNRILGSEYFIMTPEMRTVSQQTAAAAAAATAAGQFVPKVLPPPVMGTMAGEVVIDDAVYLQDGPAPAQFYPGREFVPAVPLVVANGIPVPSPLMAVANSVPFVPEHLGATIDVPQHGSHDEESQDSPDTDAIPEPEQENTQSVPIQQPQPQNQGYYGGGPRAGGYSNPRGRMGYQGGRGRGGFPTGRGGRGGRGGFQGGSRSDRGFYDQGGQGNQGGQGGFYPRNQNYYGGRGGRGPRNYYNNHSNGPAPPQQAAPPPQAVAAGTA